MESTVKSIMTPVKFCGFQWNPVIFSTILLDFMKFVIKSVMKSDGFHMKSSNSSEIPHFLLVFHMESGGFYMKTIKSSEIHNEIHSEICIIWKLPEVHQISTEICWISWNPQISTEICWISWNRQNFTGFHEIHGISRRPLNSTTFH